MAASPETTKSPESENREEWIIVLDTNSVYCYDGDFTKVFHDNLKDLANFIKNLKNIKICIPKIVVEERITQRAEQVSEKINKLKRIYGELNLFGIQQSDLPEEETIRKKLKECASNSISREKVFLFDIPKPPVDELIKRAYLVKSPFKKHDSGFKDVLIWYTILENCKDKNIILVTKDSDFEKSSLELEFKSHFGKKLEIVETIEILKLFLEKEFKINKNLEEEHNKIKNEIKENINNILFELIGEKHYGVHDMFRRNNKLLGGFLIKEVVFNNISENGLFIDLTVKAKAKLFDSQEEIDNQICGAAVYTDIIGVPYYSWTKSFHEYPEENIILNITLSKLGNKYQISNYTIQNDYMP